jgi:hypothetical protein
MSDNDLERKYKEIHEGTLRRRAHLQAKYGAQRAAVPQPMLEMAGLGAPSPTIQLETVVRRDRPVFFVAHDKLDTQNTGLIDGPEAQELFDELKDSMAKVEPMMPLVGRIDVERFPGGADYIGTGWFIEADIVVTNRHVAVHLARWNGAKFVFTPGTNGGPIGIALRTTREYVSTGIDPDRSFEIESVLYIAPDSSPHDIAFLKAKRTPDGSRPVRIELCDWLPRQSRPGGHSRSGVDG